MQQNLSTDFNVAFQTIYQLTPTEPARRRPIDHRVVYTAARRVPSTVGNRRRRTCYALLPSPPGAVNTRPPTVAVYIALAPTTGVPWRNLISPKSGIKFLRKLEYTLIFADTVISLNIA